MKKRLCFALIFLMLWGCAAGAQEEIGRTEAAEEPETAAAHENGENPETDEASPTVAPPSKIIQLKKGSRGEEVLILQQRLQELGYFSDAADGEFGSATRDAVLEFQRRNGLDVDGIAGKQTQKKLYSGEAVPMPPPADPVDVLAGNWPVLTNLDHPVSEDFVPADLVLMTEICSEDLVRIKYPETLGVRRAVEALAKMLTAAREEGLGKWQVSAGYRSYAQQVRMLENSIQSHLKKNSGWSRSRARKAALRTVAEPGASEHHLGLSFDVNVRGSGSFSSTKQCKWMHEHCWEYGFIVRYQKGKEQITGFAPEAWHIRYVGIEHSLIMRDEDLCLEEYLEKYAPDIIDETEEMEDEAGGEG